MAFCQTWHLFRVDLATEHGHGAGQQLYYAFKLKGSDNTAMCAGTTCTRLILTRTSDSTGRGHRRRMRAERCFDFSHVIINDDPQASTST